MTRTSNARLAGFTFLLYIAAGIASMQVAGHAGATSVLAVLTSFCALVLGVTLWAITREVDPDLAMMALVCRVIEAVPGPGEIYFAVGAAQHLDARHVEEVEIGREQRQGDARVVEIDADHLV